MGIGLSSSSSDDGGDGGAEAGGEVDGGRDGPLRQLPAAELEQRLPRPRLFSAVDAIVLIDVVEECDGRAGRTDCLDCVRGNHCCWRELPPLRSSISVTEGRVVTGSVYRRGIVSTLATE